LDDKNGKTATFNGNFDRKTDKQVGFSFDYNFTGGGTDGAQLEVLIRVLPNPFTMLGGFAATLKPDAFWQLHFAMNGNVAQSPILDGSGHFSTTFDLGSENAGKTEIMIRLVKGNRPGKFTTATVSNLHLFSL